VGVLLAFAGCAFITLHKDDAGGGSSASSQLVGNLIFLAQIVALAGFFIAEKPLLRRWTPLATLAYAYAIASCLMLLAAAVINSTPSLLDAICP
jgi:hypothetical protein